MRRVLRSTKLNSVLLPVERAQHVISQLVKAGFQLAVIVDRASAQILHGIGDNGTIEIASAVEFKGGVRCVNQGGGATSTVDGYLVGASIENLKIGGHQRRVGKGRSGKVDGAGSRHVQDDLRIRWRAGPRDGVDVDVGISIRGQAVGIDVNGGPSGSAGWRNKVQVSLNRNVSQ